MSKVRILVPFYNAAKTLPRLIESLSIQTSQDFDILFLDDGSEDESQEAILNSIDEYSELQTKYTSVFNHENIGIMRNVIKGVNQTPDEMICCICDGDDFLYPHAVETIIDYYEKHNLEFAWSNFTYYPSLVPGFCRDINPDVNPRIMFPFWWMSHMRTWKAGLFKQIPEEKFKDFEGNWYDYANDLAIMFALWEETDDYMFIPDQLYYHDVSEGENTTRSGEKREVQLIEEFQIRCQLDKEDMLTANHYFRHVITFFEACMALAESDKDFRKVLENKNLIKEAAND